MRFNRSILSSAASRYAFAAVVVVAAQLLRAVTIPGARVPFLFFFPAVMAAAWFGGLGPGVFALATSAAFGGLVFDPRMAVWMSTASDWVAYALFLPVGTAILVAVEGARRARVRAEVSRETLDQALDAARTGYWTLDVASGKVTWSENFESAQGTSTRVARIRSSLPSAIRSPGRHVPRRGRLRSRRRPGYRFRSEFSNPAAGGSPPVDQRPGTGHRQGRTGRQDHGHRRKRHGPPLRGAGRPPARGDRELERRRDHLQGPRRAGSSPGMPRPSASSATARTRWSADRSRS